MSGSGKKSDSIDALVNDLKRNYDGAEVGKRYDGKYRVTSVGEGTIESIIKRLGHFSQTEIVYLILERTDG